MKKADNLSFLKNNYLKKIRFEYHFLKRYLEE